MANIFPGLVNSVISEWVKENIILLIFPSETGSTTNPIKGYLNQLLKASWSIIDPKPSFFNVEGIVCPVID